MNLANLDTLLIESAPLPSNGSNADVEPRREKLRTWAELDSESCNLPLLPGKYGVRSVTQPRQFVGGAAALDFDLVILAYTHFAEGPISRLEEVTEVDGFAGLYRAGRIAILKHYNPGAPMAVLQLERLIALGVRSFLIVGIAGGLASDTEIGDVFIADQALRDEGTSRHYLPASRYAWPDESLRRQVSTALRRGGVSFASSRTWTTDAFFRETPDEVDRYVAEGCSTVEMEASAVFSVAHYRSVRAAALFVVSDLVRGSGWRRERTQDLMEERIAHCLKSLSSFDWKGGGERG
ncbi:MAG: nucleoside phosphorylase [Polyangiaceae bacterium]